MIQKILVIFATAGFLLGCVAQAATPIKSPHRATYTVKASFKDVRQQIIVAIGNQGLKVNNISYIGKMLNRTGKDLGFKTRIYSQAQAFEFCSATMSRETMEADRHNIIFCPYIILVYEMADAPGTVYVSYRRPVLIGSARSKKSLKGVEKLLDTIIMDATSWF